MLVPLVALAVFAPSALASAAGTPSEVLERSAAALDGRGDGSEITPLLKELAVALPKLDGEERAQARLLLARPTQGEGAGGNDQEYTVDEHDPPYCTAHFCVHWVDSTADAPPAADQDGDGVPDYVETTGLVFEQTYEHENVQLGWRAPKSDGARGCPGSAAFCMNRTDVYLKDVGGRQVYGYAAPDPGQRTFQQ
jgi:hypothetical protein